jgi:hypothetical protein
MIPPVRCGRRSCSVDLPGTHKYRFERSVQLTGSRCSDHITEESKIDHMDERPDTTRHQHTADEERRIREAALDKTIEASFPASDPPSTDPNPDAHEALEDAAPPDEDPASDR